MLCSPHSLANYYMPVGLETMTLPVSRGKTEDAGGTQNKLCFTAGLTLKLVYCTSLYERNNLRKNEPREKDASSIIADRLSKSG